jgi:hypothetical protein
LYHRKKNKTRVVELINDHCILSEYSEPGTYHWLSELLAEYHGLRLIRQPHSRRHLNGLDSTSRSKAICVNLAQKKPNRLVMNGAPDPLIAESDVHGSNPIVHPDGFDSVTLGVGRTAMYDEASARKSACSTRSEHINGGRRNRSARCRRLSVVLAGNRTV